MKTQLMVCAAVASMTLFASSNRTVQAAPVAEYRFAARQHVDQLAYQLWQDANAVCWEMYRHYRHNPGFRETYGEMYKLMVDAEHIHDLVHDDYHHSRHDVDHISRDLHEIDELFHHIEDDIRHWTSSYRSHYHDYGHIVHGGRYGDQLTRKIEYLEDTLHHLMADYGVRSQLVDPPVNVRPNAPPRLPAGGNGPRLQIEVP